MSGAASYDVPIDRRVWSQRGSVAADGHAALIARLSSLCDGSPANTEQLHYHDKVYTAGTGSTHARLRAHVTM